MRIINYLTNGGTMKQFYLLLVGLLLISNFNFAQEHELTSEVKELKEFHGVIYKVWHNAWPKKDITMLQSLLPEIEESAIKLTKAQLPGILRDKKEKWNSGIAELNNFVDNYKNASSKRDSLELLNSAEKLHSQFENLARIIKPVTKEVDQFHQELYLLYHYYMPENDYDKIYNSTQILESRMKDLMNAELPEKLINKKEDYDKEISVLETSVNTLIEAAKDKNNMKKINEAINKVHSTYQTLEKIFD
jgi:hypothetical protein